MKQSDTNNDINNTFKILMDNFSTKKPPINRPKKAPPKLHLDFKADS